MKHGREKESIKKRSALYIIKTTQKIERKLNERNSAFVLGEKHFSRKRKQMLFVCLFVHAFVFSYFMS